MLKVSVVVPIFGVEKYIERCARSLFSQTIDDKDVEFIFVNDGTKDSSIDILRGVISEFPGKNVEIINHPSNLGLPAARQTGVKAAHGDYLIHCDSDDWVAPDYCLRLYEEATAQDADIVVCNYWLSNGGNHSQSNEYDDRLLADPNKAAGAAIALKTSPYVWNKMVKRALYEAAELQFPCRFLAEDWALTVQLIVFASKIAFINDSLYYYYTNPDSVQKTRTKDTCLKNIVDEEVNVRMVEGFLAKHGLKRRYKSELIIRKAITKTKIYPCILDKECRRVWRRTFREANWTILFNKGLDGFYKKGHLKLLLGIYMPLLRLYHFIHS